MKKIQGEGIANLIAQLAVSNESQSLVIIKETKNAEIFQQNNLYEEKPLKAVLPADCQFCRLIGGLEAKIDCETTSDQPVRCIYTHTCIMKIWTSEHTFNHPWETVTQAAWRKYPNPMTPSIIGTDVVERKVVDGVLHTHRLVQSKWYFPKWTHSLIGTAKTCFASERSTVDPQRKQMVLKTINLTFCRHISVDEVLYYEPHPTDSSKTLLKQEASVSVQGVPLCHYMEDMLTSTISKNAGKGRQGLEWVIGRINEEVKGITETADDFLMKTKHSLDDMTESARKSMDEISAQAAKHIRI